MIRGIPNFHTHTTFCDGRNTAEEMVQAAIAAGCPALGFSGHVYTAFDPSYCMSREGTLAYKKEVRRLAQKYRGQIQILLGIEQDYYSEESTEGYDYVIGSVHYVLRDGCYIPVDESREILLQAAEEHYGGDIYALIEDYYRLVADVKRKTRCDIVGHFDLITKFNEKEPFFSEKNPRYRVASESALHMLMCQDALLEINTGAISRGYRTTPYPSPEVLKSLGRWGVRAILSSDCHSADAICCGFEDAMALAEQYGVELAQNPLV